MKTYAAIFYSLKNQQQSGDYQADMDMMLSRVKDCPGYSGKVSVRDNRGHGVTVSYWRSREAILSWRSNQQHRQIQSKGKLDYYQSYYVRRAKILHESPCQKKAMMESESSRQSSESLLEPFYPAENSAHHATIIISYTGYATEDLRQHVSQLLLNSNYSGIEYIVNADNKASIGLIHWADIDSAEVWYQAHQPELAATFNCALELCDVEKTYGSSNNRLQI